MNRINVARTETYVPITSAPVYSRPASGVAVWEPSSTSLRPGRQSKIRTLEKKNGTAAVPTGIDTFRPPEPDRRAQRGDTFRTYLVGAIIGVITVSGTLHLSAQEEQPTQTGYLSTISAEVYH